LLTAAGDACKFVFGKLATCGAMNLEVHIVFSAGVCESSQVTIRSRPAILEKPKRTCDTPPFPLVFMQTSLVIFPNLLL
jgi:hypothetical protein